MSKSQQKVQREHCTEQQWQAACRLFEAIDRIVRNHRAKQQGAGCVSG